MGAPGPPLLSGDDGTGVAFAGDPVFGATVRDASLSIALAAARAAILLRFEANIDSCILSLIRMIGCISAFICEVGIFIFAPGGDATGTLKVRCDYIRVGNCSLI